MNFRGKGGVFRQFRLNENEKKSQDELVKKSTQGLYIVEGGANWRAQYFAGVYDALTEVFNALKYNSDTDRWELNNSKRKYFVSLQHDTAAKEYFNASDYKLFVEKIIEDRYRQ